jgi:hypothetical protein
VVHAKKADGHQLILDRYMTMIPALDLPEAKYAVLRAAERELPARAVRRIWCLGACQRLDPVSSVAKEPRPHIFA